MTTGLLKFALASTALYLGYKLCQGSGLYLPPITRGASSSAEHDAIDATEEAAMDSFPASDPPAQNIFK